MQDILVPIAFFAMIAIVVTRMPFMRGRGSKFDRTAPQIPNDVSARMERMEQAIDAIALEVERISEGQRFTTKLLSETRSPDALPATSRRSD